MCIENKKGRKDTPPVLIRNYIPEMQMARGIGIVLVSLGHSEPIKEAFPLVFSVIYSFHMPLFFFMSGFFSVSLLKKSWFREVLPKTLSLVIPYIVISISYYLIKTAMPALAKRPVSLEGFCVDLFLYPLNNPALFLWFLYIIILLKLLSPLVCKITPWIVLPVLLVGSLFPSNIDLFGLSHLWSNGLFFYGGLMLFSHKKLLFSLLRQKWIATSLFIVFVLLYYLRGDVEVGSVALLTTISGILLSLSVCFVFFSILRRLPLEELGKYSLELYLLQYYFIFVTYFLCVKLGIVPELIVFFTFVSSVTGPMILVYYVFPRVPLLAKLLTGRGGFFN